MSEAAFQAIPGLSSARFGGGEHCTSPSSTKATDRPTASPSPKSVEVVAKLAVTFVSEGSGTSAAGGVPKGDASTPAWKAREEHWSADMDTHSQRHKTPSSQFDVETRNACTSVNLSNIPATVSYRSGEPLIDVDFDMHRPSKRARFEGKDHTVTRCASSTPHLIPKHRLVRQKSRTGLNFAVRAEMSTSQPPSLWVDNLLELAESYSAYVAQNGVPDFDSNLHEELLELWSLHCDAIGPMLSLDTCNTEPVSGCWDFSLDCVEEPSQSTSQVNGGNVEFNEEERQYYEDVVQLLEISNHGEESTSPSLLNAAETSVSNEKGGNSMISPLPSTGVAPISTNASQTTATSVQLPDGIYDLSYGRQQSFWRQQGAVMDFNPPTITDRYRQPDTLTPASYSSSSGQSSTPGQISSIDGSRLAGQFTQGGGTNTTPRPFYPILNLSTQVHNVAAGSNQELVSMLDTYAARPENQNSLPVYINGHLTTVEMHQRYSKEVYEYRLARTYIQATQTNAAVQQMIHANDPSFNTPDGVDHSTTTLHPCGWRVGPNSKCNTYISFDKEAIQLHFEIAHPSAYAWSNVKEPCMWGRCKWPPLGRKMVGHIMAQHIGENARYRICNHRGCMIETGREVRCADH